MSGEQVAHVRRMLQGLWPWILPPDQAAQRAVRSDSAQMELKDACGCVGKAGRSFIQLCGILPQAYRHSGLKRPLRALVLTLLCATVNTSNSRFTTPDHAGGADAPRKLLLIPTTPCPGQYSTSKLSAGPSRCLRATTGRRASWPPPPPAIRRSKPAAARWRRWRRSRARCARPAASAKSEAAGRSRTRCPSRRRPFCGCRCLSTQFKPSA